MKIKNLLLVVLIFPLCSIVKLEGDLKSWSAYQVLLDGKSVLFDEKYVEHIEGKYLCKGTYCKSYEECKENFGSIYVDWFQNVYKNGKFCLDEIKAREICDKCEELYEEIHRLLEVLQKNRLHPQIKDHPLVQNLLERYDENSLKCLLKDSKCIICIKGNYFLKVEEEGQAHFIANGKILNDMNRINYLFYDAVLNFSSYQNFGNPGSSLYKYRNDIREDGERRMGS